MGQIITTKPMPLRGNLRSIQTGGDMANTVLRANQFMLISEDNSMSSNGSGYFNKYIVGDGSTPCSSLTLYPLENQVKDFVARFTSGIRVASDGIYLTDKSSTLEDLLNNQTYVKYDINTQNLSAQEKVNARANIDSENLVTGYYTATAIDANHPSGFYAESNYTTLITNTYNPRKLYLDLGTWMVYAAFGGTLHPIAGQPISSASYNSNNQELTITFNGGASVTIPFSLPVLTAGQGIDIDNNTISQNYLLVTEDELLEYLNDPDVVDDGIIRYVYEEEESEEQEEEEE